MGVSMKMKKSFAGLAAVATVVALALLPSLPAQASARTFLSTYGADEATHDRLIDTCLAGGTWDSMSSSSEAVSVVEYTAKDGDYSVSTYADGSIAVTRTEIPDPKVSPLARGIGGCSVSGKAYSNCKIDTWVGVVQMAFRASYSLSSNQVTNAYGYEYTIVGACGASPSLSRPAGNIARLNISAQMCVLPYSTAFWLQLTVSGGSARVSWNDF